MQKCIAAVPHVHRRKFILADVELPQIQRWASAFCGFKNSRRNIAANIANGKLVQNGCHPIQVAARSIKKRLHSIPPEKFDQGFSIPRRSSQLGSGAGHRFGRAPSVPAQNLVEGSRALVGRFIWLPGQRKRQNTEWPACAIESALKQRKLAARSHCAIEPLRPLSVNGLK